MLFEVFRKRVARRGRITVVDIGVKLAVRASLLAADWAEALAIARRLGACGVELEVPPEYGANPLFNLEFRRGVARSAGVLSVRLEALERYSFCAKEDRLRAEAELLAIDVVDACSELGCRVLVLPLVGGPPDEGEDPPALWAASLRSVAYAAEDKQVALAVEPRGEAFAPDARAAIEIVHRSGSPAGALALEAEAALGAVRAGQAGMRIALVYVGADRADALGELARLGWSGVAVVTAPDAAAAVASAREVLEGRSASGGGG